MVDPMTLIYIIASILVINYMYRAYRACCAYGVQPAEPVQKRQLLQDLLVRQQVRSFIMNRTRDIHNQMFDLVNTKGWKR